MKIKQEVLQIFKQSEISECGKIFTLPNIQMDRKLYVEVNKILESIGFKWNRKHKCHLNIDDVLDKYLQMIDTGEWLNVKKELQFFPTPSEVVDKMVNMVDLSKVKTILEPSCGLGNIADKLKDLGKLTLIEINKDFIPKLQDKFKNIVNVDFMDYSTDNKFDLIVANPPFTKLQSVKHFFKMIEHLNDGGQLVCILPISDYDYNSGIKLRRELTSFIDAHCEIERNNSGAFKESGTMVDTIIVKYIKQ